MAQKSLLNLVQTAASELNLPVPVAVVSSTDQTTLKMLALLRAVCDDLLREFDWQQLHTRHTFTTSDGVESYSFPSDYERSINGTFFDQTARWPLSGPNTPSEWESIKVSQGSGSPFSRFRVYNGRFYVTPTPSTTPYTFVFEYISNNYVKDGTTGVPKSDFTQDSDVCLFDHRLLVYGLKLKFKSSLNLDTSEAMTDYMRSLEFLKGADSPAPKLNLLGGSGYRMLSTANYPDDSWSV